MTPTEFLRKYRIEGLYLSRNGPRLYIEKGNGINTVYRNGFVQRCYIDLRTFTAHSVTTGPNERQCAAYDEKVSKPLAVLARLARMAKVRP
jgi:hypothetical protein